MILLILCLSGLFSVLNFADAWITVSLVKLGMAEESNPMMREWMLRYGPDVAYLIKIPLSILFPIGMGFALININTILNSISNKNTKINIDIINLCIFFLVFTLDVYYIYIINHNIGVAYDP